MSTLHSQALNETRITFCQEDQSTRDAELKAEIQAIYNEHKDRNGYRRIRYELTNRGQKVNHMKVQRIMRELGLKCLI